MPKGAKMEPKRRQMGAKNVQYSTRSIAISSERALIHDQVKKKWNTSTKGGDVALFHKSPKKKREHKRGKKS